MEWFLIVFGGFVLFFLGSLVVIPWVATKSMRRVRRYTPEVAAATAKAGMAQQPDGVGLSYQQVWIDGHEGVRIHGWWIADPQDTDSQVLIFLHGMHLSKIAFLSVARGFAERGLRILMLDLRAHGMSEGRICTFGLKEKFDIHQAINWLESRHGVKKVALMGVSLGGIVGMQAAALDPRIVAAVIQSPYTTLENLIRYYARRKHPVMDTLYHAGIQMVLKKTNGVDIKKVDLVSAVQQIAAPKLFILGELDVEVPASESRLVYQAARQPAELWEVAAAGHNNIHKVAGEEYWDRITDFIKSNVNN